MGSLNSTLGIATQSLLAQEAALSVTNNNISNANTAGYAREIANLVEASPTQDGSLSLGNGVDVASIQSVRDQLIENSILTQTANQGSANAQVNTLNEIQTLFPNSGSSLSSAFSSFFTSLSALSSSPTSTADRQTVIANAQALVQQFNSTAAGLTTPVSSLNTQVQTDVAQINTLTAQAAALNQQIAEQGSSQNSGPLTDQLGQVESQLAALTSISVTHGADGDSISTANGTSLVLGTQSYALSTTTGASGNTQVLDANGNNVTASLTGGDLGGTIQVRDTAIPSLLNSLDTLANQFGNAFNAAQAQGYNLNGSAGAALFNVPSTVAGSAAGISLATTDPNAIAASSDGTTGSNGNVANLTALETTALPSGQSATDASAGLIYQVGELTANATAESSASSLTLTSLNNQQSAVSGVSIDEETANLIRYQQAYEAAAKVVSTVSSLFTTTINMLTTS